MKQNNRITGRRICAAAALAMVTACGILAPAASAATGSTPPHSQPYTVSDCVNVLLNFGYTNSTARTAACGLAGKFPNPVYGVSLCIGGLRLTGVLLKHAVLACGGGAVPGFAEEEWCYNNGGFACLNAWGGGPFVNAYAGGPETRDTNADFAVIYNNATGYNEIAFTGDGPWSGDCIGDSNNNPSLADVGLVACGTAPGNQGWGTNMTWGTEGCPSGEAWFFDYHWNGWLGPPDNYVDGSHFFLNKPIPICFSVTFE